MIDHEKVFSEWRSKNEDSPPAFGLVDWPIYRSSTNIPLSNVISEPVHQEDRLPTRMARETIDTKEWAWGVYEDNKLVSWAVCRFPSEWRPHSHILWVGVETLDGYRHKGYAKACLVALRRAVECEYTFVYMHTHENFASGATALSAGFIKEKPFCLGAQ